LKASSPSAAISNFSVDVDFAALCDHSLAWRGDLIRNIRSIRVTQDLFDDLADSPEETRVAQTAEARGRVPSPSPLITRPFDYGSVITWSFETAHLHVTRFSDGTDFGVWYGGLDLTTTVYETVFHWHRFLMDSFATEDRTITGERRAFHVYCDAVLLDMREKHAQFPGLTDRNSYAFTQQVGRYLAERAQNGLLVKSARCEGTNAAIFDRTRLSRVRDCAQLTYLCNPTRDEVLVERTSGHTWLTIQPSLLG
jgi:RES domain